MDSADSTTTTSAATTNRSATVDAVVSPEEHCITSASEDHERPCWGCGLRLLVSPYAPAFKCGWCGAITNENVLKRDNRCLRLKHLRDRCFVIVLILFMVFIICGGVWAVYPILFSINYYYGVFHLIIAVTLSISTITTFSLTAFRSAGAPPNILWGSYPAVGKGGLENYTFCHYCSKPKSPRTHHCRSCGMCVLDMDHHCPFIGNCVGAANHRFFIMFLISAVISMVYVTFMSGYAAYHSWPQFRYGSVNKPWTGAHDNDNELLLRTLKEFGIAFLSSMMFLPARGVVLTYLFMSSVSVEIGLSVLLWQQMCYIYRGKTYLSHLSSRGSDEKDCENIVRFFGCPYSTKRYLPMFVNSSKIHKK